VQSDFFWVKYKINCTAVWPQLMALLADRDLIALGNALEEAVQSDLF